MASTSSAPLLQHLEATTLPEASSLSSLPLQILTSPLRAFQHAETFALRTVPQTLARIPGMNALGLGFWSGADRLPGPVTQRQRQPTRPRIWLETGLREE